MMTPSDESMQSWHTSEVAIRGPALCSTMKYYEYYY